MADKLPYYSPNGLRVVKLTTHRVGIHNPGELCGFEEKTAQALVDKGWAQDFTPEAAVIAKHDEEKAKKGIPAHGANAKVPEKTADESKKDVKPAAK